ncbi:MAG: 3-phosphoshikimate 1-carboxyvinyltransferase [Bacteroidota bacterium]|nr:3-phosphoshikimate 1-carboxyvinyltransferase [Bacteroidota bacterium]
MKITVNPKSIDLKIVAPGSKSACQRAVAIAALSEFETVIHKVTFSDDVKAALSIAEKLGNEIIHTDNSVKIIPAERNKNNQLNCGESGLAIRMFGSVASLVHEKFTISGKGSLNSRPVNFICETLTSAGLNCETENNRPPIHISGRLNGQTTEIDGSQSSQILTGLLISLPLIKEDSTLRVKNLKSKPYIDLTLNIMKHFGVKVKPIDYKEFRILGRQKYHAKSYHTEGDWSAAAFLFVAGAVAGRTEVTGLNIHSTQGDKTIMTAIENAGAKINSSENTITVEKSELKAFTFNAVDCPDLFPPLVSLAFNCEGTTVIKGIHRLKHKESNRAAVLQKEYAKLGGKIILKNDSMYITGKQLSGGITHSTGDHRIAMALSVSALTASEPVVIKNADSINKSYPNFYSDIQIKC